MPCVVARLREVIFGFWIFGSSKVTKDLTRSPVRRFLSCCFWGSKVLRSFRSLERYFCGEFSGSRSVVVEGKSPICLF